MEKSKLIKYIETDTKYAEQLQEELTSVLDGIKKMQTILEENSHSDIIDLRAEFKKKILSVQTEELIEG